MPKREETKFTDWMSKIGRVEKVVKARSDLWQKYLSYYRMEKNHLPQEAAGDSIWLNYQFAISRIILPSIYYRNPDIIVSPKGQTPYAAARVRELLINYHLGEIDFETEMRKVVFNALFGMGVMKYGFVGDTAPSPAAQPFESLLEDIFETGAPDLDEAQRSIDMEYHHSAVKPTLPFAVSLLPRFFLIDEHATCIEDARWVGHRVYKSVDDLKESTRYNKRLVAGIQGTHTMRDEPFQNEDIEFSLGRHTDTAFSGPPESMVVLYEIWDRQRNELLVLDSWNMRQGDRKFLREEPNPYKMDGFPLDILVFNPDPENPLGVCDAATWHNPTNALNLLNSMHFNHVKRFNRKYAVRRGVLKEEELAKLQSPDDGTIVEVDDDTPADSVVPIQDAAISPDLYGLRDVLRNEMNFLTGVTEERRGQQARGAKTATEASLMEKQAQLRDSDRLYLVSRFVERGVRKLDQLNQQFLTADYVSYVTIPEALMTWVQNKPEEAIKAEVEITVRVGSSAFVSREVRVKQLIDFLNIAGQLQVMDPMTGQPVPVVNIPQVIREIADGLNIHNLQEVLNPAVLQMLNSGMGIQPAPAPAVQAGGPAQDTSRRTGGENIGDMLSGVQNLGVRRQAPNPTNEMAQR